MRKIEVSPVVLISSVSAILASYYLTSIEERENLFGQASPGGETVCLPRVLGPKLASLVRTELWPLLTLSPT